jgi:predicted nucleotidyltransferase
MTTVLSSTGTARAPDSTTPADTARHLRRVAERRRRRAELRSERLRGLLPEAAKVLRERYHATDVRLFGSLATGSFGERSDVDLAVSRLPRTRYFAALADLMELFGTPVDLVRLEEAPSSLRERIRAEGEGL